jgi:hypothetical protein
MTYVLVWSRAVHIGPDLKPYLRDLYGSWTRAREVSRDVLPREHTPWWYNSSGKKPDLKILRFGYSTRVYVPMSSYTPSESWDALKAIPVQ